MLYWLFLLDLLQCHEKQRALQMPWRLSFELCLQEVLIGKPTGMSPHASSQELALVAAHMELLVRVTTHSKA